MVHGAALGAVALCCLGFDMINTTTDDLQAEAVRKAIWCPQSGVPVKCRLRFLAWAVVVCGPEAKHPSTR